MTITLTDITVDHPDVFCALTQFHHSGYIPQEALFKALEKQGIPKNLWPKEPTQHVCLGRALKSVASRKDRVESISDGWVLTVVDKDKLDLEDPNNTGKDAHEVCVTAKVIKENGATLLRITPPNSIHEPYIRHEYTHQQSQFKASEDISRWLTQTIIPWVGGVSSRARGGSYYVYKNGGLDKIKQIKAALDEVSTFSYRTFTFADDTNKTVKLPIVTAGTALILKPEVKSLDAIRIMLNSIIEETDSVCDDLADKLNTGKLKKKGIKGQIKQAEAMEERLKAYSKALGLDLSDINSRLTELKTGLGLALLQAMDNKT